MLQSPDHNPGIGRGLTKGEGVATRASQHRGGTGWSESGGPEGSDYASDKELKPKNPTSPFAFDLGKKTQMGGLLGAEGSTNTEKAATSF